MGWMTLIGDLHGRAPIVRPDSYLILLAGDICPDANGMEGQARWLDGEFRAWLERMPCPVVAVPGNHDRILQRPDLVPGGLKWHLRTVPDVVEVAGLSIFCNPYVRSDRPGDNGAFVVEEEKIEEGCQKMPDLVDVVLTHSPALGWHDRPSAAHHLGSLALRYACWKKRPRLVVNGHIHEARGWSMDDGVYSVNATLGSGCSGTGYPVHPVHPPWGLSDNSWRK